MQEDYFIYLIYFVVLIGLGFSSACISDAILLFLKHLGYPLKKNTKWYLTWLIFTVFFQIGLWSYVFYRLFLK